MHIAKNKKISSFWEVKNRSFLRFRPHSGRPKVMKIMTFSQHEKHENSMAGVVNLRLGGVQKSGKIESEKNKKTRKCRHPKTIKIARSWSFGRSKTGDGSGGNNSLFRYFPDPGGHDGPKTPPKGDPSPPTLDFLCFFIDLGSMFHRCLIHLGPM